MVYEYLITKVEIAIKIFHLEVKSAFDSLIADAVLKFEKLFWCMLHGIYQAS